MDRINEIIRELDRGYDLITDQVDKSDDYMNLDKMVKTYRIPDKIRARFQTLMGDADNLQGTPEDSRKRYLKALKEKIKYNKI